MRGGFRASLKEILPEHVWPLMRWLDNWIIYLFYVYCWLQRVFRYPTVPISPSEKDVPQVRSFVCKETLDMHDPLQISAQLQNIDIPIAEGLHSVYIGSRDAIYRLFPDLLKYYPEKIGLKIVRSRDISPDGSPYYTSRNTAPASTWFSMRAIGSIREKMVVSNLLSIHNVAPRVYDLVTLKFSQGNYYALVVEHIDGSIVVGADAEKFIQKFRSVLCRFGMATLSIKEHRDLRPPNFSYNIVGGIDGIRYVDIQNFTITPKGKLSRQGSDLERSLVHQAEVNAAIKAGLSENVPEVAISKRICVLTSNVLGHIPAILNYFAGGCDIIADSTNDASFLRQLLFMLGYGNFKIISYTNETEDQYFQRQMSCNYEIIILDCMFDEVMKKQLFGYFDNSGMSLDSCCIIHDKQEQELVEIFRMKKV